MSKIDLYIHTSASDASFSPEEIIDLAIKKNLKAIATIKSSGDFRAKKRT